VRELVGLFVVTLCVAGPLNSLLPLFPLVVRDAGGTAAAAGVLTAAVAIGTVVFELASPRLLVRWHAAPVLAASLVVMGAAALALAFTVSLTYLMLVGVVLGVGFGTAATVSSVLPGAIERGSGHGAAFGVYGFGSSVPAIVGPPAALLALPALGIGGVLAVSGSVALVGAALSFAAVRRLPVTTTPAAGLRLDPADTSVLVAYGSVTFAYGAILGLAVLYFTDGPVSVATFFLLLGIARAVCRTLAPSLVRTIGGARAGACSLLAGSLGLACLAAGDAGLVAAAVLFGAGFGASQTVSLQAVASDGTQASGAALWNFTTDAGMGLGALVLAPVAVLLGYHAVFAALATLVLAAVTLHVRGLRPTAGVTAA
jgi:hypothetical protein